MNTEPDPPASVDTGQSDQPNVAARRPRRRLLVRLLLTAVIFLSGGVVGAGVALIAVRQGIIHGIHHPEEMPRRIAHQLRHKLDLTDEQTHKVERILQQRQAVLQEIRGRYQPEVEHELDRLQQEVDEVLDANQRARWNITIENMRSTWIPKLPNGSESGAIIRDDGA